VYTAVADTSFIIAVANRADAKFAVCDAVKRQQETVIVPQSVLAEVGYMICQRLGNGAMAHFLRTLDKSKYRVVALETADLLRTADILDKYADSRVDFVDASVVAVAETYNSSYPHT
jgi:uncharacterized protein